MEHWNSDTLRAGLVEVQKLAALLQVQPGAAHFLAREAEFAMRKEQGVGNSQELDPGEMRQQIAAHLYALGHLITGRLKISECEYCENCRVP